MPAASRRPSSNGWIASFAAMQHQRRYIHLRQQVGDVDVVDGATDARGIVRRRRDPLQIIEPLHLLGRAAWQEQRREELSERRILLAPALSHQRQECLRLLDLGARSPPAPSAREAAVENQPTDALRDCAPHRRLNRAALRHCEQRKALQAVRLDDAFEIADEGIERDVVHLPVRQPVAAGVIADQPMLGRKRMQKVAPDRTLPVVFEMVEPVGGLDQRRSLAGERVGDANAIGSGAEMNLLLRDD